MQNNYGNPGRIDDQFSSQRGPEEGLFRQRNRGAEGTEYAGFWVRLAAYCIDLAVVWIGLLFVRLIIGIASMSLGEVFRAQILFHYTLRDIILYVLQTAYFILLTYYTGTTLGKRLMNLRVINADGRERLGFINIVYRETVGRFLCGLSIGIGYIMAGVDREKRGLHDMLCDTRVIYGKKIKVFPKYGYQVPVNYPPIPPAPPVPPAPMPPYGMPPGGETPGAGTAPAPMPPGGRTPDAGTAPAQMPPGGRTPDAGTAPAPMPPGGRTPDAGTAPAGPAAAGGMPSGGGMPDAGTGLAPADDMPPGGGVPDAGTDTVGPVGPSQGMPSDNEIGPE